MKLLRVESAADGKHRYKAVFLQDNGRTLTTRFGDPNLDNYTIHKNPERKRLYLLRHRANENWNDPTSAGALSRWLLWDTTSFRENVRRFKNRFNV